MSLSVLMAKVKESGAERVYFAPNEQGVALDGEAKRALGGGPVQGATILAAISELLSQDDIGDLSSTRPRIVRHEYDGQDFVLEVLRQPNGLAVAIRQAARAKSLRDSVRRDEPADRQAASPAPPQAHAPAPPAPAASPAAPAPSPPPATRQRPPAADRRTVRAEVDEDGNVIDPLGGPPIELHRGSAISLEDRVNTKPVLPVGGKELEAARASVDKQEILRLARSAAEDAAREVVRSTADATRSAVIEAARAVAIEAAQAAASKAAHATASEVAHAAAVEAARTVAEDVVAKSIAREIERITREALQNRAVPGAAVAAPAKAAVARSGPAKIDRFLRDMLERKASDLHLSAGSPAVIRVDGEIHFGTKPLASADIHEMMTEIITDRARGDFEALHDADFAYEIPGLARFRVNVFADRHGTGAVLRQIPIEVLTAEKLGLPKACLDMCWLSKGLVLVTGPTGSGKSTTLAAMIDFINKNRSDHIITIEDPVEFVHQNQKCLVNQREVGQHTKSFKNALRAALREDPDIVLVGEMRDLETISIAIETAETGHLVFGTLHTTTAVSTVDRIIDQFPADRQDQIRVMLSESLKGVVAQVLCPKVGGGRVAAHEILLGTPAVAAMVREGKTFQLTSVMQTSKGMGMVTMNDSLMALVQKKLVDPKQAYIKAVDKNGLLMMFKAANIPSPV